MGSASVHGWLAGLEGHIKAQAALLRGGAFEVASIGKFKGTAEEIEELGKLVEKFPGIGHCIPFSLRSGNQLFVMLSAHQWGRLLAVWATTESNNVPTRERHSIMALLMGYAPEAIHEHSLGAGFVLPSHQEDA